jgi:hypothetical protein
MVGVHLQRVSEAADGALPLPLVEKVLPRVVQSPITLHSRTVPSSALKASAAPSGENATLVTYFVCPLNVCSR